MNVQHETLIAENYELIKQVPFYQLMNFVNDVGRNINPTFKKELLLVKSNFKDKEGYSMYRAYAREQRKNMKIDRSDLMAITDEESQFSFSQIMRSCKNQKEYFQFIPSQQNVGQHKESLVFVNKQKHTLKDTLEAYMDAGTGTNGKEILYNSVRSAFKWGFPLKETRFEKEINWHKQEGTRFIEQDNFYRLYSIPKQSVSGIPSLDRYTLQFHVAFKALNGDQKNTLYESLEQKCDFSSANTVRILYNESSKSFACFTK